MSEYPARLHHHTPGWVKSGALFHIRIRAEAGQAPSLTDTGLAAALLNAARRYHHLGHWWCEVFLLVPDHVHAIAAFPSTPGMSVVLKNWKRGTARFQGVCWQENFFDHRLRSDEESEETWHYIRRNPVVKGLCVTEDDWNWWCVPSSEPSLSEGALKTERCEGGAP